ncbi:hypothetical protein GGR51DRAFT_562795 [Nemania sp. FL0031]|nr:hypothetical protein GGR51DRAFT_562795 [Nemania sp. FL0031]
MYGNGFLSLATLATILGVAHGQDTIGFGPYFSLGPTQSWIREATTTLVLPKVPSPQEERLALWPGMGTSGGDLIQALAVSFQSPAANCGASAGQWCTWASTLQGKFNLKTWATNERNVYNDSTGKYDQTVAINGNVVSSLSTSSGYAEGWGTAVECQVDACTGTVASHQYVDTVITLNAADSTFARTLAINEATSSGLTTSDNKVFKVSTINIQSHTFNI